MMSILEQETGAKSRRFNRDEYYRMADEGFFQNQRVELIDGEILVMSPHNDPHASAIVIINRLFARLLPPDFDVRPQLPLSVNFRSEPEPDIAIVDETCRVGDGEHAGTAKLVIEVASTTLRLDRRKAHVYASAGVNEYWIVDLHAKKLHVYREPTVDAQVPNGATYGVVMSLELSDSVTPVAIPVGSMRVASLFPQGNRI